MERYLSRIDFALHDRHQEKSPPGEFLCGLNSDSLFDARHLEHFFIEKALEGRIPSPQG